MNSIESIKVNNYGGMIDVEFYFADSPDIAHNYYEFKPDSLTRNVMESIVEQVLKTYNRKSLTFA